MRRRNIDWVQSKFYQKVIRIDRESMNGPSWTKRPDYYFEMATGHKEIVRPWKKEFTILTVYNMYTLRSSA